LKSSFVFAILVMAIIMPHLAFATKGTASVNVGGMTHQVSYDATGLTVNEAEADKTTGSLTIFVTTNSDSASLTVTLDRSFFDSKTNGQDEDFLILADGFDTPFDETKTSSARTLTISVPSGTKSLDIVSLGTTGFAEQPPTETPVESPAETSAEQQPPTETPPEPSAQCGPGTVLKDGLCVVKETPATPQEAPKTEPDQTQCGPGTILKDGACVLDETCGPGTTFKDGACVVVPQETGTQRGSTFQLLVGIIAAFVIAFIVIIILWAIGRAGRKKNDR
jgi:hypothetical protein